MVAGAVRKATSKPRKDGFVGKRYEYFCGTYFKAVREQRRDQCSCLRNGVFQDVLEVYIERFLQEAGHRLQILTDDLDLEALTAPTQKEMETQHDQFVDNIMKVYEYVRDNDPTGWGELVGPLRDSEEIPYDQAIEYYRRCFTAERFAKQLAEVEAEHDTLTAKCMNLTTERSIAKANDQLAALELKIERFEQQQKNVGDIAEQQWREVLDLSDAIKQAERSMSSDRDFRRRSEDLRAIIQRIECKFTATGKTGSGWGNKNSELATVTIYPVSGDSVEFSAESKGTLMYSSAHSRM